MAALDLITLADLKDYIPATGNARDAALTRYITVVSRSIETELERRLVYRAPPEVSGAANIVASTAWVTGSLTIAAQPDAAGRTLIVSWSGNPPAGAVTFTGTVAGVSGQTEVFDVTGGLTQHGLKFFTAISSAVAAGAVGASNISVGSSVGYVEYHTPQCSTLPTIEWPISQVVEVNEDASRSFAAATAMVAGTDYLINRSYDGEYLQRLVSALPFDWLGGWRSVRVTYSGGYRMTTVPEEIRDVCRRLAKLTFEEIEKGRLGIRGQTDQSGNWQRWGAAGITDEMRHQLRPFMRNRFGSDTGVRDFDLEAA